MEEKTLSSFDCTLKSYGPLFISFDLLTGCSILRDCCPLAANCNPDDMCRLEPDFASAPFLENKGRELRS